MASLKRCWDLTDEHIDEAIGSRTAMGHLIRELAAIAKPNDGAPKMLIALARLAQPECDWLEGSVRVELEAVGDKTQLTVIEDLGGIRELVFPRSMLNVPIAELERSVRTSPRAIAPLAVTRSGDKVVLAPKKNHPSRMLPAIEIADDSLRRTRPPPAKSKSIPPARARSTRPAARKSVPPPAKAPAPPLPKIRKRSPPPPAPAAPAPPSSGTGEMLLEMPRASKVLDFGDFEAPTEAKKPRR